MGKINSTNHLITETSPYLLQHAHNPVDWYPWEEKVLAKARHENKPILLSIGYAACHWCHVMAHESFEDIETAKIMNDLFVNIKVDREERPDLDKIYQTANHLLTQRSGGWPLTVFLTPDDLTPFFSGTYFPREQRYNLPSFKEVLHTIADLYQKNRNEITQQNKELLKVLNYENIQTTSNLKLNDQPIQLALQTLQQNYDAIYGGFGDAPKFPHPSMLEFLLKNKSILAENSLKKMAEGGIYDQLAGGFFRYSVDAAWRIPHFEKMLYDNSQLLFLYALAKHSQNNFELIAYDTAKWILDKMQFTEGGFYSSLDADSEGHEGKYYIWNKFEVRTLLSPEEYNFVSLLYGLNKEPNFEKNWHLYIAESLESVAEKLNLSIDEATQLLTSAKEKLLHAREKRILPACDNKILTSWNALMIKALFTAGEILQQTELTAAADKALHFILQKLWVNKRLLVSYKDNKSRFTAYLDDYAYLLDALITKLQISWESKHLSIAIEIAECLLNHFQDLAGGFYFTANDHEKLLHRPKTMMDEAIPSGNGIAARALMMLGYLVGEERYLKAAEKTIHSTWNTLIKFPAEHCSILIALNDLLDPPYIIVIRGPEQDCKIWQQYCKLQINHTVFTIPDHIQDLPGLLSTHKSTNKVCAYICKGTQCLALINDFEKLKNTIGDFQKNY